MLKDLKLKAEALNSLKLPVTVKAGFIGTITLKVIIIVSFCALLVALYRDMPAFFEFCQELNDIELLHLLLRP